MSLALNQAVLNFCQKLESLNPTQLPVVDLRGFPHTADIRTIHGPEIDVTSYSDLYAKKVYGNGSAREVHVTVEDLSVLGELQQMFLGRTRFRLQINPDPRTQTWVELEVVLIALALSHHHSKHVEFTAGIHRINLNGML